MRRFITNFDLADIATISSDVVIVGCGVAGLYAALSLDSSIRCVLLNKTGPRVSNSMYAQGGIAAVIDTGNDDDPEQHFRDTITAGAGLCDEEAVRVLTEEAASDIESLIRLGVPFDREGGRLLLTCEGGHKRKRILHCGGDATGLHITQKLLEAAARRENINICDGFFLSDILSGEHGAAGVLALDAAGRPMRFAAPRVIIASGGIGRVYEKSTNAVCATGDGIAAAARAGAVLKDLEFVQFHPTALTKADEEGRYFLISEAVRGEGGILKDAAGEAFMRDVHPMADLAPRDIVSRAIFRRMRESGAPHMYLDISQKSSAFLRERFPTIWAECLRRGLDISQEPIPILPVQHYFMGGLKTDINGETNIPGLFACGEAACTGVHGANRLASNSLLECLVFARRAASKIAASTLPLPSRAAAPERGRQIPAAPDEACDFDSIQREVRMMMTQSCGIERNEEGLCAASSRAEEMMGRLERGPLSTKKAVETYNMVQIASSIIQAALLRKESVGAHWRNDGETRKGEKHD